MQESTGKGKKKKKPTPRYPIAKVMLQENTVCRVCEAPLKLESLVLIRRYDWKEVAEECGVAPMDCLCPECFRAEWRKGNVTAWWSTHVTKTNQVAEVKEWP